jgi:hypothetical protein
VWRGVDSDLCIIFLTAKRFSNCSDHNSLFSLKNSRLEIRSKTNRLKTSRLRLEVFSRFSLPTHSNLPFGEKTNSFFLTETEIRSLEENLHFKLSFPLNITSMIPKIAARELLTKIVKIKSLSSKFTFTESHCQIISGFSLLLNRRQTLIPARQNRVVPRSHCRK